MTMHPALRTLAIATFIATSVASCQSPEQKFDITVVDEQGLPVEGVECKAWFKKPGQGKPVEDYFVIGHSSASGQATLSGETIWAPTSVEARKDGHYLSLAGDHWTRERKGNRWEPWPVEVKFVMKKIGHPKPMYVAKFDGHKWLSFPDKQLGPFGFDLVAGDWVQPHGQGKIADFILEARRDDPNEEGITPKGRVLLSFSNPGDGVLKLDDSGGSVLVGPSMAPADGYVDKWEFVNWRPHPDEPSMINWDFSGEVYVFRVRTKLDESGNVLSSHYGKIDGRILGRVSPAAPRILMTYYFNGTENDIGLEWDQKNNLIRDTSRMRIPERP